MRKFFLFLVTTFVTTLSLAQMTSQCSEDACLILPIEKKTNSQNPSLPLATATSMLLMEDVIPYFFSQNSLAYYDSEALNIRRHIDQQLASSLQLSLEFSEGVGFLHKYNKSIEKNPNIVSLITKGKKK